MNFLKYADMLRLKSKSLLITWPDCFAIGFQHQFLFLPDISPLIRNRYKWSTIVLFSYCKSLSPANITISDTFNRQGPEPGQLYKIEKLSPRPGILYIHKL